MNRASTRCISCKATRPCASYRQLSSSMATSKKKTFDAVAQSRRWRVQTGRKLRGLTFEQQQELLRRTTEEFFAARPARRALIHH